MTIVRRTFARTMLVVLAATAIALVGARAADASCAPAPPLEQALAQAEVVFVGTVLSTDHGGLTANFSVYDVWRGEVGATAVVHGGPGIAALEEAARKGQGVATSVDRTYATGTQYLVFAHGKADGVLLDNICSSTQAYKDDLASLRPASAHAPFADASGPGASAGEGDGRGPLLWTLLTALGALCTGLAIVVVRRARLRAGRAA